VKRTMLLATTIVMIVALTFGVSTAMAAKPQKSGADKDVIALSNGFPSGPHETLNIHGKKADYQCVECVPCATCDPPVQCNVVNIPEYTSEVSVPVTITYVSGRKVKIDELTVFDSCAGFDEEPQEDGAEVWLPYEANGYWVFARALGKPAKGDPNDPAYVPRRIIFQNAESDNPMAYTLFGDVTEPGDIPLMMPLGLITNNGAYKMVSTEDMLVRFDSEPEGKGRGKNQGKDITDMFMWSGWVFQPILDLNGDGAVNELDVEYACWSAYDFDGDGIIEDSDLVATIWDANGDTNIDRLDLALIAPCSYDANGNGVIDPWDGIYDPEDPTEPNSEFETWLFDNTEGYVFPMSLDLNGDGAVDELDVEYACWSAYDFDGDGIIEDSDLVATIWDANGDTNIDRLDLALIAPCSYDANGNGVIDPWDGIYDPEDPTEPNSEFETWLDDNIPSGTSISDYFVPLWAYYDPDEPVWVFTIADLVYQNQVVTNEGIKNLQIRFYPVDSTEFTPVEPAS
jgi:hypothetical protein